MNKDPYLSDWENTVEAIRKQEEERFSIESKYEPPQEDDE